ncbi:hypothetical protein V8E54_014018 [Elaphomyces granulatus]
MLTSFPTLSDLGCLRLRTLWGVCYASSDEELPRPERRAEHLGQRFGLKNFLPRRSQRPLVPGLCRWFPSNSVSPKEAIICRISSHRLRASDRRPDQRPAPGHDEHPDEGGNPSGSGTKGKKRETTLRGRRKSRKGKDRDTGVVSRKDENTTFNAPIQPGGAEDRLLKMPAASMGRRAFWALDP